MLVDTGELDIDKNRDEWTPLSWAARKGIEAIVELLVGIDKASVGFQGLVRTNSAIVGGVEKTRV